MRLFPMASRPSRSALHCPVQPTDSNSHPMIQDSLHRHLSKFLLLSAFSFFIGAIHGMLQVMPPVRAWLDSIGSPYGGPGHMIDPLAHAHMNLVGGVVMLAMGTTYHLLPIFSGKPIYSLSLVNYSFWWTSVGVF